MQQFPQMYMLYHLHGKMGAIQVKMCLNKTQFFFFFWQWYEPDAAFGRTVIRLSTIGFTLPKSAILICPSEVSSKFSGCQENVNYFLFFMSTIIEQTSIRNLDITVYQSHVVYVFEGIDHFCSIKPSFILWQTTFLLINYSRFRMKKTKM